MKRIFLIALSVISFAALVWALDPVEEKAQTIDKKLVAPCCWTATLDQHFSEVAEEMKTEIRTRLAQGQSEQQIIEYYEKKYGERILSEPKAAGFNLTVWIFPIFALGFGVFLLLRMLSKSKAVEENTNTMTVQTTSPERDEKYKAMIEQELYRK